MAIARQVRYPHRLSWDKYRGVRRGQCLERHMGLAAQDAIRRLPSSCYRGKQSETKADIGVYFRYRRLRYYLGS